MRLAVVVNNIDAQSLYLQQLIHILASNTEVMVISNIAMDESIFNHSNLQLQIIPSLLSNALARKFWYDVQLKKVIKKYKADAVLYTTPFISSTIKIRQLYLLQNILPSLKTVDKATVTIANNQQQKLELVAKGKVAENKITVIHPFAPLLFKPLTDEEKQTVKDGYADGREFYLWVDDAQNDSNALDMLKAFSQFKKRLHSNMKLVLVGMPATKHNIITTKLASYKYKDDVVVIHQPSNQQFANVLAAAYAIIHTPVNTNNGWQLLQALQCQVPIITTHWAAAITGNAAVYIASPTINELADAIMNLYKNETQRNEIAQLAASQTALFTAQKTAAQIVQLAQTATT
jgi:glycosyltransferase involved in cell wall biosynthesis